MLKPALSIQQETDYSRKERSSMEVAKRKSLTNCLAC